MAEYESVLILDFGGQYTQLIARRVRELHVFCEIAPFNTPIETVAAKNPKAIILSGGPASVYAPFAPVCEKAVLQAGIPVLGICYGAQLMASLLGGSVEHAPSGEYGKTPVHLDETASLFHGLPSETSCWMSHTDRIGTVPPGFRITASTPACPIAAMENADLHLYGVQFHLEVTHTPEGCDMLRHFLFETAHCSGDWTMTSFMENAIQSIRSQIGSERALCALSGGVDSSVAATLVYRAIGDHLTCVFVDTGLLRAGEGDRVESLFHRRFDMPLVRINASARFFASLSGVTDPEQKRKAIGAAFIDSFAEQARTMHGVPFLVQGTLYPDVIESGSSVARTIKSHHNVGGLPADLSFSLIEPLRMLFKDEVRDLGRVLGLPEEVVDRQPFPGPGLGVRILGEVTPENVGILQRADAIVERVMRARGWYTAVWQSFAILPNILTVGVQGDGRTYAHTIALRVVESSDGMTADWVRLPADVLEEIAHAITSEIPEVNRVVYDITSKPPSTIEWE
ncbi:glutamine-hydrolyzing GMP synthase [bacterium]|nr:glutamine-hydrolyzing GMP synthase [bacterium]